MVEVYKRGGSIKASYDFFMMNLQSTLRWVCNRRDFEKNVFIIRITDNTRYP